MKVPRDYSDPQAGTIEIYAYTVKPFDASKPSYIYVDGGPGQNTHGMMSAYTDGTFNEFRFDQRGLGCSSPDSYDTYMDPDLYSSMNNIRDMEKIRDSFGIKKWSVYGVSYGTIPSTMYASKYGSKTNSVVIEGVYGRSDQIHSAAYKAEKMNLALEKLNSAQRRGFTALMTEDSADTKAVLNLFQSMFYSDIGMRTMAGYLERIISADGTLQRDMLARVRKYLNERERRYPHPQQPGAVDSNVIGIIYCKNMDARTNYEEELLYSKDRGFYSKELSYTLESFCNEIGVTSQKEEPYRITEYPVQVPTYYFQGSHDGATMAIGAISHWKTVPKGRAYFMLAQKGGHNPNIARLENSENPALSKSQKTLFVRAISAQAITSVEINQVNLNAPAEQAWKLYTDAKATNTGIENELKGINRLLDVQL